MIELRIRKTCVDLEKFRKVNIRIKEKYRFDLKLSFGIIVKVDEAYILKATTKLYDYFYPFFFCLVLQRQIRITV